MAGNDAGQMQKKQNKQARKETANMKVSKLFKGHYIKADQLDGQRKRVTISDLEMVTIGEGKEAAEKPVLRFEEMDQGLILNRTNANTLCANFGDESDNWLGRTILLCPEETDFGGKRVGCVRIRIPKVGVPPLAEVAAENDEAV